tara:strand:+ start:13779 stop:14309 length:531 start_codon:yes stop_codon:yes gene_type:complete
MANVDAITELALAGIDAEAQAQALLTPLTARARLPFSMLHAYASDASYEASDSFHMRLAADARAQDDLSRLMARTAFAYMPRQAAAASTDVVRRETAQAMVTLTPSRADDAQVFVIITLSDADAKAPTRLTLKDRTGAFADFDLGPFSAGRVQLLLRDDDPIVAALRDAETEVFLR